MVYSITILIALLGAGIASFLKLPMGAVFGAAVVMISAGKLGLSLQLPRYTLIFVQLTLGMAVGLAMPSGIFSGKLPLLLLIGLISCMCGQILVAYFWLNKKEHWSKLDSLLGAMPGALGVVLAINESQKAPSSKVIFTHSVRLIFLIIVSGFIVATDQNIEPAPALHAQSVWLLVPFISAFLFGVALEKVGIAAPHMITGMLSTLILSAAMPAADFTMPSTILFIASAAFGAIVGIRLKDITGIAFVRYIRAGIIATVLSLLVTVALAYGFSYITGIDFVVLLMSWAPGSIETMTVAAVYLGLEPAFILLSHSVRMLILYTIPLSVSWYNRAQRKQ